jgi:hypothetical protein
MLQNLLDVLEQPVRVFLPEGKVAFANPAARTRLAGDLVSPARHPSVPKMLRDLAGGRLALPARLALSVDCASGATARLDGPVIEGRNQRGAALIADPLDSARELASRLGKLLALVDAFTADQIVGDDRIVVHELVAEVWRDLEPTARALRVTSRRSVSTAPSLRSTAAAPGSRERCTSARTTRRVTAAPTCRAPRRRARPRSARAGRAPS